ncbi:MAG: alkaline phosphatase family protein [Muribaculaceae bacterium]|nr:alkaline phosphatase family protein [Muribaculaceae bacterium]
MRINRIAASLSLILALSATCALAQVQRPRLIVGIVVDQMRWDYLYQYYDKWGEGGFKRLMGEGYSCGNTIIDYVPTVTACGHASIYTGSTPALHGIAGNDYMIDGKPTSSVKDTTVVGVGTTGKAGNQSPRNLLVTTMGDQLKLATSGLARVVGVSLKDRAAILPAGHGADGAYWYDNDTHQFITSTYYTRELPKWVKDFNKSNKKLMSKTDVWRDKAGVTVTFGLAQAALKAEHLGGDFVPDLLAVSISTTDAAAHKFGAMSAEMEPIYLQLDKELTAFFKFLDKEVGKGNYLLFLTADHGGTYSEPHMKSNKMPSGRFFDSKLRTETNEKLRRRFGVDNLIQTQMEYTFYLNNDLIVRRNLDREAVKAEAVRIMSESPEVMWAVDAERVNESSLPQDIRERIIKGYHHKRSGEIFVLPITGYYASWEGDERGSNHGSWNQSDSHIPLLFYGWHVPHGEKTTLTHMTDIAATVCAMLHIQAPDACLGQPIKFD